MKQCKFASFLYVTFLSMCLIACSGKKEQKPLLKGNIAGAPKEMELYYTYSLSGDMIDAVFEEIQLDSAGNFEFPHMLPDGVKEADICIYIGPKKYGAHVENGKTAELNVTINPETMEFSNEYLGDNTDISEFYGVYETVFDLMRYFSLDESDTTTFEQYSQLLNSEYERLKPYIDKINDNTKREYYSELSHKEYLWQKARIIMDDAYNKGIIATDYPEYTEILSQIDPNNETDGASGLYNLWIMANSNTSDFANSTVNDYIDELNLIDSNITYAPNRHRAFNIAATSYLTYTKPTSEDTRKYMDVFNKVAADCPDLIEKYNAAAQSILDQVQPGDTLPYDPTLETPDGKTVKLSDLFGKVLYIDMWATWCVPCCREIPYLEKLDERFNGNDKIEFVSISIDSDKDAWLKKIETDKPAWPQYILPEEENKKFSQVMGISSIPRFMIIGSDGKFVSTDAERPCNDNIDNILKEAIAK